MNGEVPVSVLALVVALLALCIALGQLLQQIFGTAEGYRRCQASVIGPWARRTRLSWRWSQFRFETKFTTPEIRLGPAAPDREREEFAGSMVRYRKRQWFDITKHGHDSDFPGELRETVERQTTEEEESEAVTWTELLRQLYKRQLKSCAPSTLPAIREPSFGLLVRMPDPFQRFSVRMIERSWDLMPTDVVRPFASSKVGTVIVLAHRLGMQWRELNPGKGIMNADGNGHTLSSSTIRGLGTVLQYYRDDTQSMNVKWDVSGGTICSEHADKLRCGIIASSSPESLGHSPGELSRLTEICLIPDDGQHLLLIQELFFELSEELGRTIPLSSLKALPPAHLNALNDTIALTCPFMPIPGRHHQREIGWPIPTVSAVTIAGTIEGCYILMNRLAARPNVMAAFESRADGVLAPLQASPVEYWANLRQLDDVDLYSPRRPREHETITLIRRIYDETTAVFFSNSRSQMYDMMLGYHIHFALEAGAAAQKAVDDGKARTVDEELGWVTSPFMKTSRGVAFQQELAHQYADRIARAVGLFSFPPGTQFSNVEKECLWWVLMLRLTCWFGSVDIELPESVVPSYLYYSQTPVYIT